MRQMQDATEQREWAWRGQEVGEQPKQNAAVVVCGHNHVNDRVDKVMCVSSRCGAPVEAVVELLP
jgi:hypothetical protein